MDIIFLNHLKSQCGIYEIGKRIYELLDKSLFDVEYLETPSNGVNTFMEIIEQKKPKYVICNYYPSTLSYINKELFQNFPNIKFIGIIHDLLNSHHINFYDSTFDAWIIHDTTNSTISKKKFTTIRPIRRHIKKENNNKILNIGSHGFSVSPWKMFDYMIKKIDEEFDEVFINMNITRATFGGADDTHRFNDWKKLINKENVHLNISNQYFETENELIDFLSKNDMNVYFYNSPDPYIGVGGSADLAISAQSSLVVNNTHMYRHIHEYLGYYDEKNKLKDFLNNKDKVLEIYEKWNPSVMNNDYKKMLETL